MNLKIVCLLLHFLYQTNGFMFALKPVGAKQAAVTTGDVIIYDSHFTITAPTPFSFHVSLPHDDVGNVPIFNVEDIEVLGIGANLKTSEPSITYSKENSARPGERSQASVDLGSITRSINGVSASDDVVLRVKSRVLDHSNVTTGAKFWLYFGMDYQNESVWIIGKSVKVFKQLGSGHLDAKVQNENFPQSTSESLEFDVNIYHMDNSKAKASSIAVELNVPSFFTLSSSTGSPTTPTFSANQVDRTLTITVDNDLKVGQSLTIHLIFTIGTPSESGKLLNGHFYGDLSYQTTDEVAQCSKTVTKKHIIQKTVKIYSQAGSCDSLIPVVASDLTASSQYGNFGASNADSLLGSSTSWQPCFDHSCGVADEFLQITFGKLTTLTRLSIAGHGNRFVKTFHISYSDDGVFWEYLFHHSKHKEFQGNKDGKTLDLTVFNPVLNTNYIRIHPKKISSWGAALRIKMYGCKSSTDSPATFSQRSYIVTAEIIIVCNAQPNRKKRKANCYCSKNLLEWEDIDFRVINVIGFQPATMMIYGLGMTLSGSKVYMELKTAKDVRIITEQTWNSVSGTAGLILPKTIPMKAVGALNRMDGIQETQWVLGEDTYIATSAGILKNSRMFVSWTEYGR